MYNCALRFCFYKIKVKPLKFYFFRVKQEDGKIHKTDRHITEFVVFWGIVNNKDEELGQDAESFSLLIFCQSLL